MTDPLQTTPAVVSRPPSAPAVPRMSPARSVGDAIVVLALASLPFVAVLGGGFVADDFFFVAILEHITQPFGSYVVGAVTAMRDVPTTFYRPLAMASLLADLRLFAGDPWAMHLVNLVLHAVTAVAVWGIARRMVQGPHARSAAITAALAWAWFPRRVETVAWISCRPDLLATGLATLGLWMWVEGARAHRTPMRAAGVLTWGLAMLAKESVVTLPLALVAWPALDSPRTAGGASPVRFGRLAARAVALWPFILMGVAYFAARRLATGAFVGAYGPQSVTWSAGTAARHLVYPLLPPLEWLNRWMLEPGALVPVAIVVAVLGLASWTVIARTLDKGGVAFGASWWIAAAIPAMPLLPSLTTTFNDRLLYLPGIGCALVAGAWWADGGRRLRVGIAVFFLLASVQTVLVAARWPVAGDMAARLVADVAAAMAKAAPGERVMVAAAPDSYRGAYVLRNGLAFALQRAGATDPGRAAVLSHYLLDDPALMPVHVEADRPEVVRVSGLDGAAEVMVGDASPVPGATYDATPTRDRYGRRADVRITLSERALVLVAAPDGVHSLGSLGPTGPRDPQSNPRVGPRQ